VLGTTQPDAFGTELALLTDWVREVATTALADAGVDAVDYLVGTMIETPRAAIAAA